MATSAVALFGVLTAKATGAPLAEGVAYDASGNVTTDAGARVPGDRSAAEAAARVKADALPIPTKIWESITRTAEHGLAE